MSAESMATALADTPLDEPEEVITIASAAWTSGEDDALSLVHHLGGRDPLPAGPQLDRTASQQHAGHGQDE